MADSKRQKIVDAIVARMETILTSNGYSTNIGQNVHEWETNFQQEDLATNGATSVCDLPATAADTSQDGKLDRTIWLMPVQIRHYAEKEATPANTRTRIKDIQAAIRTDPQFKITVGLSQVPLAMQSWPETEGPMIPEQSFEVIGGVFQFTVQFITRKFDAEQ